MMHYIRLRKFSGAIHALVSDIVMPNLDGLDLCDQIRRERPEIKLLLMSGNRGPVDGIPFLQKPFNLARRDPEWAADRRSLRPQIRSRSWKGSLPTPTTWACSSCVRRSDGCRVSSSLKNPAEQERATNAPAIGASPEPSMLLLFSAANGLVTVRRLAKRRLPLTT
jgi:hypothetical protein